MEIQQYIKKKREIQNTFLSLIENNDDMNFDDLISIFEQQEITKNFDELKEFLNMVLTVANHHHRTSIFLILSNVLFFILKKISKQIYPTLKYSIFSNEIK